MKKYFNYLSYLFRHKWEVFKAGRMVGVGYWQLLIHDWTKFTPAEFMPYVNYFNTEKTRSARDAFDAAWNHHQKKNPHHWQYWVVLKDSGDIVELEMPRCYRLEMVADWIGAGRALGKPDILGWYNKNRDKIRLHVQTRCLVEDLLQSLTFSGKIGEKPCGFSSS